MRSNWNEIHHFYFKLQGWIQIEGLFPRDLEGTKVPKKIHTLINYL